MLQIKAHMISDCEPGIIVTIKGRRYMRATEFAGNSDLVVDLENGWIGPWTYLILQHEEVVVEGKWKCPACLSTGVTHCADPVNCEGMKIRKV